MECKHCDWYRRKLSPLEDKELTTRYCNRENLKWLATQLGSRQHKSAISVKLGDVWVRTFGTEPSVGELTKLGRTLSALGWERSRQNGLTRFVMSMEDFNEYSK